MMCLVICGVIVSLTIKYCHDYAGDSIKMVISSENEYYKKVNEFICSIYIEDMEHTWYSRPESKIQLKFIKIDENGTPQYELPEIAKFSFWWSGWYIECEKKLNTTLGLSDNCIELSLSGNTRIIKKLLMSVINNHHVI